MQPSATSVDNVSPFEQSSELKLDTKRDLRLAFRGYVLAIADETNNSMRQRVEPCIALGGKPSLAGSVWMLNMKTCKVVTRDQFVIQPMLELVIVKNIHRASKPLWVLARYGPDA